MPQRVQVKMFAATNSAPTIPPIDVNSIQAQLNAFLLGIPPADVIGINAQGFSQYGSITTYIALIAYKTSVP